MSFERLVGSRPPVTADGSSLGKLGRFGTAPGEHCDISGRHGFAVDESVEFALDGSCQSTGCCHNPSNRRAMGTETSLGRAHPKPAARIEYLFGVPDIFAERHCR